jgi:hypothetical protein
LGDVASSNAPATLCEKDGKEVFFIQRGRFIGYRYQANINIWSLVLFRLQGINLNQE